MQNSTTPEVNKTDEKKEIVKPAFESTNSGKYSKFFRGAAIGGTVGVLTAIAFQRKAWVWGLIGIVAGGYIATRGNEVIDSIVSNPKLPTPPPPPTPENKETNN